MRSSLICYYHTRGVDLDQSDQTWMQILVNIKNL